MAERVGFKPTVLLASVFIQRVPPFNRTGLSHLYATTTPRPYLRTCFLSCWSSLRSYRLRPILVRDDGIGGKDRNVRIEASGSPDSRKMSPCHEARSQEPRHAAASDVRYRYTAGQLEFDSIGGGRGHPAHARSTGTVAAESESLAEMALRRWAPALSRRCSARLSGRMR
jgi:hypothetical protein